MGVHPLCQLATGEKGRYCVAPAFFHMRIEQIRICIEEPVSALKMKMKFGIVFELQHHTLKGKR
jgi:hypothetical protein